MRTAVASEQPSTQDRKGEVVSSKWCGSCGPLPSEEHGQCWPGKPRQAQASQVLITCAGRLGPVAAPTLPLACSAQVSSTRSGAHA
jgi:hypothetical protein